jgi:hypothetical protein
MDASADEARLLFQKWAESSTAVRIRLVSSQVIFDGVGAVQAFSDSTLELGGDSWQVTLPLTGATYVFSDPRDVPNTRVREAEESRYELGLAVDLPSGDRVVLLELKDD